MFDIDMQEKVLPTDEDVEAIVSPRITASLESALRSRDSLQNERMRRFIPLARSLTEAEEESPLIAMLLDDYYQRTLQAPPQAPEDEEAHPEQAGKREPARRRSSDGRKPAAGRSGSRRRRDRERKSQHQTE